MRGEAEMDFKSDAMRKYGDIIDLPHHVSDTRPRMSMLDRAAQFSPFAALTGYEAVLRETGRLTDDYTELDEDARALLDEKLRWVSEHLAEGPEVSITYFQPDGRKEGGAYVRAVGKVKKFDGYEQNVVMEGGTKIFIKRIADIGCGAFDILVAQE